MFKKNPQEPEMGSGDGPQERMERLAWIMARLRGPDGCIWDLEQTPVSLSRHLLEEAYESVEAIESGDWRHLEEELGDLMLQIVFQSRIAEEHGRFDLSGVIEGITDKLERRHPHIFGTTKVETAEQVSINWDRIKSEEKCEEAGIVMPVGLPAVLSAMKIQERAARAGFDWSRPDEVFEKLNEEVSELLEVKDGPSEAIQRELGDLLFTVINISRHLGIDPETALRDTCREFVRRYTRMEERALAGGLDLESLPIEKKEELWQAAKDTDFQGEEK